MQHGELCVYLLLLDLTSGFPPLTDEPVLVILGVSFPCPPLMLYQHCSVAFS